MTHWKQVKLQNGEVIENTSEKGNSMTPLLNSGEKHTLIPVKIEEVNTGDIVFCKVKGKYYTHLVVALGAKGCLISNNHGHINGWSKNIYGRVSKR